MTQHKIPVKMFVLNAKAKTEGKTTRFLNQLDSVNEPEQIFTLAREILTELLHRTGEAKRFFDQHSPDIISNGIHTMFDRMEANVAITAAPKDEKERRDLYIKLAGGYRRIGEFLKEAFEDGKLEKEDVYACLETIGDGGHACCGRWRQVLEEVLAGFSDDLEKGRDNVSSHTGQLDNQIRDLFFKAGVIEGNRAAEVFVATYYPRIAVGSRLHYITFFKRFLNASLDYHLPTTMEEDSYLEREQGLIAEKATNFLEKNDVDDWVLRRFLLLFEEKIKKDAPLFGMVVDYAGGIYHKSGQKAISKMLANF